MATSFQTKTFNPFAARARVAGSICAIALAATGLIGLGLKTDARESQGTPMPQMARGITTAPIVDVVPHTYYVVTSEAEADAVYAMETDEYRVRVVFADSMEGQAVIDLLSASWGSNVNARVVDLRR